MPCCISCLQRQSQSVALAPREANFVTEISSPVINQPRYHIPSLAFSFVLKSNLIFDLMDEKSQLRSYSLGGMWFLKIEIVYHFKKISDFVMFNIFWKCAQSNTFPGMAATKVLF